MVDDIGASEEAAMSQISPQHLIKKPRRFGANFASSSPPYSGKYYKVPIFL
jgi:hypothetical protein